MKTKDFDYYLPEELIAQTPLEKRDESRLMCLDKETGELSHHHFYELPNFLNPGDCLILNNSRVLPARLLGQRLPGGGACEVLLLIDRGDKTWECIVRPGKHLRKGTKMQFGNGELKAEVVDVLPDGNRMVKFDFEGIFLEVLEHLGKMPLPPYIKEELQDQERYQTVYSKVNGSAAAPTAGLHFTPELAASIREDESRCDHYEDVLGTYLVKLSAQKLGEQESEESAELLKAIGDFERISDHAVNVLESAEELREKGLAFSDEAKRELSVLSAAVNDILMRALDAFRQQDMTAARQVEPLEQVIDDLKEQLRTRHILRMQQGQCSIEAGFVWSDLLTDLERTSDHCSNIAGCVIDAAHHDLNMHATLDAARHQDPDFREQYRRCAAKYQV